VFCTCAAPYNHCSRFRPASLVVAATSQTFGPIRVNVELEVIKTLRSVLSLDGVGAQLNAGTALLGSIPELDSMAVVSILTTLEERFEIVVDDDEVDGRTFATVGSLTRFVQSKLGQ
jgi:acyl carrier protein